MKTVLFTPYAFESAKIRAHMMISEEDASQFDALPKNSEDTVVIYDTLSRQYWLIARADCGAGCRCGAVILCDVPEEREESDTSDTGFFKKAAHDLNFFKN